MVSFDRKININGVVFIDVTNQTVAGPVYTRKEAEKHANRKRTGEIQYVNSRKDMK